MHKLHIFPAVTLFWLLTTPTFAATKTAVNSAKWEQGSTWSGGVVPACGDTIVIPAGKQVEVTSILDFSLCAQPMQVTISGELTFQTGKKLKLPCGSVITLNSGGTITAGGGGGNSNLIDICNTTVWNAAQGTVSGPLVFEVNPLPVEMAFLDAVSVEAGILITWITLSETNNAYFTIERSKDGIIFEEIGRVNGYGTTSQPHSSNYLDIKPFQGNSYYRIKQTDFNGGSTVSKAVIVTRKEKTELQIYPNPTFGDLFVNLDEQYRKQSCKLMIHTVSGNLILSKDIIISNTGYGIKLLQSSEFLKPGKYLVTLKFNSQSLTEQIIVK